MRAKVSNFILFLVTIISGSYANSACSVGPAPIPTQLVGKDTYGKIAAFSIKDCATMVMYFPAGYIRNENIRISRFKGDVLDTSFGNSGVMILESEYSPLKQTAPEVVVGQNYVAVVWPGRIGLSVFRDLGAVIGMFSLSGELQSNFYENGIGFSRVSYGGQDFTFKTVTASQDTINILGNVLLKNSTIPVQTQFNLIKPQPQRIALPVPATCENYNYDSNGAIGGQSHKISQDACKQLDVLWIGERAAEAFKINTSGECFSSIRFGYSCFGYENGYLKQFYVDQSDWNIKVRYYRVVENPGKMCGHYQYDTRLIASPFPPDSPNFEKICIAY
jgi:hypothetical protein